MTPFGHMTTRRRFFPATKVQHVSGQTVELEMQLLPAATSTAPAAAPSGGEIIGAGWFSPVFGKWFEWTADLQPDGLWDIGGGGFVSRWQPGPGFTGDPSPTPAGSFRCIELTADSSLINGPHEHHVGVIQGASMADVRWEAAWDTPSLSDPSVSNGAGNRFSTWGNVLLAEQVNTGSGGVDGMTTTETLTATAYSGGSAVATIVLHCFHPAY